MRRLGHRGTNAECADGFVRPEEPPPKAKHEDAEGIGMNASAITDAGGRFLLAVKSITPMVVAPGKAGALML